MKVFKFVFLLLLLVILPSTDSHSQTDASELENTQISILTCRSGDELYSTFGHTAIRITNDSTDVDFVYNYGLFSFNTPNFYIKFMRGQLPYYLGAAKMDRFLREYEYEKRSVFEQKLNLNNEQKQDIIEFLANNVKPENRQYKYDFFYDNCATRVVDVWELAKNVTYSFEVEEKTFRDLLKENLQNLVWSDFGIDIVIGARADILTNRRDQMFLPEYVMANLESAVLTGSQPLASKADLILDYEELNAKRKDRTVNWPLICTFVLLLLTLLFNFILTRWTKTYNKVFLIICGVMGLFLLFMWFGTDHGATRDNWNVMWLNPLLLIYLFTKGKVKKIISFVLVVLLGISALNCLFTFLPQFFNLAFLPIIVSLLIIIIQKIITAKTRIEVS